MPCHRTFWVAVLFALISWLGFGCGFERAYGSVSGFGKTKDGKEVKLFTLKNKRGTTAKITNYGAILTELWVRDKHGKMADVVLGFDNVADYEKNSPYFGAIIGRYANRIAHGECTIDGKKYTFAKNDRDSSTLHGGLKGFDKRVWNEGPVESKDGQSIRFTYTSADMEEGFPGRLDVAVRYTLTEDDAIKIDYEAHCDKTTIINLTNHSYFNLSGSSETNILDHILTVNADQYTPVNGKLIPKGVIEPVKGTPFDFRKPTAIGERIKQVEPGYDINYVLNQKSPGELCHAATVSDPKSGRILEVYTTEPGLQFYSGQWLDLPVDGVTGPYKKYDGFCLEAQHYPDSPHHQNFPSVVYKPEQRYKQTTIYKFLAQ